MLYNVVLVSAIHQHESDIVYIYVWASLVAPKVKNLPSMQETCAPSLGREDSLEKEMVTFSSSLAWECHGQRSLEGYSPWGGKRVGQNLMTEHTHIPVEMTKLSFTVEG